MERPKTTSTCNGDFIGILGARLHNLRQVDAQFPVGKISVVCGPSGCGKSTLVLDVLHAESRRRYLETLSPSALQLLGGPRNVPVDAIHGLRPSLALGSDDGSLPPKANVASLADMSPLLRTLWCAMATPVCPHCQAPMRANSAQEMVTALASCQDGARLQILSPIPVMGRSMGELGASCLAQGFMRGMADGNAISFDAPSMDSAAIVPAEFLVVIDRIVAKPNQRTRLSEAIDTALRIGNGLLIADINGERRTYSTTPRCPQHGGTATLLTAAHFSPWSPRGQCPACKGSGAQEDGTLCPECDGLLLQATSRSARWKDMDWATLHNLPIDELRNRLLPMLEQLPTHLQSTARTLPERLDALCTLGLQYLTLGRPAFTLSSGEIQRLRMAGLATGHLDGVLLCLDEPAAGLHESDVDKLWALLTSLRDRGDTLVLIEHHPAIISRADWIVEMGPGAGEAGGSVLFQGPADQFLSNTQSPTAQWLRDLRLPPPPRGNIATSPAVTLAHIALHNLDDITLELPQASFTVLCGVSGSGKSTLLWDALETAVIAKLAGQKIPVECGTLHLHDIEAIAGIRPGGFNAQRRSTVATAIGLMTPLRELFASLPESKVRGYNPTRFGTASPGGRCETCKGEGVLRDPSGYEESECPVCQGSRYRDDVLDIRFKTLSIAEILECTVDYALQLFNNFPAYQSRLRPLADTGLGYLRLGQPTTHLSGGERQRLHLSLGLAKAKAPRTLYIFDEPARGLHREDIARLIALLKGLAAQGHCVVAIEHQPDFRRAADRVYTLGPGAGRNGGRWIS